MSDDEIADLRNWAQAWADDDINRRLYAETYVDDGGLRDRVTGATDRGCGPRRRRTDRSGLDTTVKHARLVGSCWILWRCRFRRSYTIRKTRMFTQTFYIYSKCGREKVFPAGGRGRTGRLRYSRRTGRSKSLFRSPSIRLTLVRRLTKIGRVYIYRYTCNWV